MDLRGEELAVEKELDGKRDARTGEVAQQK